nr:MAG TPA: hypothetical protein [Caudoviricetes sp.]
MSCVLFVYILSGRVCENTTAFFVYLRLKP